MKYHYNWNLSDSNFTKNKGKVFSCFACGGGSTMGYKLAGFDVIGFNEIDPRMANLYVKNHQPKYQFVEAMQDFVSWNEYPEELYNLDILDGSPPCGSFSVSGNREADWGKEKVFREGQKKQVLDTLFFDFIALAEKLQPKIVIAENVKGILQGKAKAYTERILREFDQAGYKVNYHLLDASKMGVPQRRERVFFVAIRKDLAMKVNDLQLNFDLPTIPFGAIKTNENTASFTDHDRNVWNNRKHGDRNYADVLKRIENRDSNFNAQFIYDDKTPPTLAASSGSKMVLFSEPRKMNHTELIRCQSFPLDYHFGTDAYSFVQYVLGMSVPPVMMANLVDEIYRQWRKIFENE
ncbi:DNA (cytosine-5-)-methyltransferase [Capnocytophaga stomatis]|uniref:Cytosine-specific methyltransferase n=1 Tax=Capnocytophaga stomatis TaxID=1848904 RepID=A0A250FZT3_9FLAO|nr:DNA cytosine methyltransferase [Capnocytophaga stomatis]ATA90659.1 DNA (cytosine-5-)-methyltransferase [Capnocytophaga stomatis]